MAAAPTKLPPKKVIVQSQRIDATLLPPGFSVPYRLYVIQQTSDMANIADASNNASDLAYQATIKNDEQDIELADHEQRIADAESELANHESRITSAESTLANHETRITSNENSISGLDTRLTTAEGNISTLQGDYVSKSATTLQSIASPINVTTSYSVNGTQVVGARQTGWTASTGTALLGAFNADQSFSVSNPPTQTEVQAIASALVAARQRIKALEGACRAHGLIN